MAHQGSWADAVSGASSELFGDGVSEYNTSDDEHCDSPPVTVKSGPAQSGPGPRDGSGVDAEKGDYQRATGRDNSFMRGVTRGGGGRGGGRVGGDRSGAGTGLGRGVGSARGPGPGSAPSTPELDANSDKGKGKSREILVPASGLAGRGDPDSAVRVPRSDHPGKAAGVEGSAGRFGGRLGGRRGWSNTHSAPNSEGVSVPPGRQSKTR